MKINFRELVPRRTYNKSHDNYRNYKDALRKDFNSRCGYTDCSDFWFGGKNNFHIDHFVPWSKYKSTHPHLKTDYSNLVYACSYVNILKSNDEGDYLDPCDIDYNKHFHRSDDGSIMANPKSQRASYMHRRLKLYLARYGIIWKLDQLESRMLLIQKKIAEGNLCEVTRISLLELNLQLSAEFLKYKKYLASEQ